LYCRRYFISRVEPVSVDYTKQHIEVMNDTNEVEDDDDRKERGNMHTRLKFEPRKLYKSVVLGNP